ncbi:hypothetical protein BH10BAC1_BH10BAC1_06080 [soil metagenome]
MPAILEKKKPILHSVEEEKNEIAVKLLLLKDKAIVHTFKVILDDLIGTAKKTKRTTKAQYNKEIDSAVKRVRSGKSIPNDQVMNEMDKW